MSENITLFYVTIRIFKIDNLLHNSFFLKQELYNV